MLKTIVSSQVLVADEVLAADEVDGVEGGDESIEKCGKSSKTEKSSKSGKSKSEKMSKSQNSAKSGKKLSKSGNSTNFDTVEDGSKFLISDTRTFFNRLWLAFTETPILQHFDLECHIRIEIDALGYVIGGVLSQLASGTRLNGIVTKINLGQWYPVAFFSRKMIPEETQYKTHNGKLLAIIKAFKTWHHYLEGCKHKVLIFTDNNNLCYFMDTKSLSSRQVHWAQKLSQYHF